MVKQKGWAASNFLKQGRIRFSNRSGFTLIELMIVVAIIAILAAIAYPSYIQYKIRTNRADVQKEMMLVAQQMSLYKNTKGTFADATVNLVYGRTTYPPTNILYDLSFDPSPTTNTEWVLVAKPRVGSMQENNGWICLNNQGQRFWAKGALACELSNTSNWDGK